jgi:transcriptional regulator with XRE-family HTH domain
VKFGPHLRALRTAKNLSQRQLARRIGTDRSYISSIERESVPPPGQPLVRRIAQALNISEVDLIMSAGHIPSELNEQVQDNIYIRRLVRVLSEHPMPDLVYRQMLYLAKKALEPQEDQSA